MIDYSVLPLSKGTPRVMDRLARKKALEAQERACRRAVKIRSHGHCEVPLCKASGIHMHHVVYRSHGGKWDASKNVVHLCVACHQLVHGGVLRIERKAGRFQFKRKAL